MTFWNPDRVAARPGFSLMGVIALRSLRELRDTVEHYAGRPAVFTQTDFDRRRKPSRFDETAQVNDATSNDVGGLSRVQDPITFKLLSDSFHVVPSALSKSEAAEGTFGDQKPPVKSTR
jgi:hypothetical protein